MPTIFKVGALNPSVKVQVHLMEKTFFFPSSLVAFLCVYLHAVLIVKIKISK